MPWLLLGNSFEPASYRAMTWLVVATPVPADIVLMSDDLQKIPFIISLARHSRRVVWQNFSFAMAVIVIPIASAFGARLPLPLGVVGHEGSTVLVVLNGLRLLGYKA